MKNESAALLSLFVLFGQEQIIDKNKKRFNHFCWTGQAALQHVTDWVKIHMT